MKKPTKFPYHFFVVTFLWSWLIWLPLVLAGKWHTANGKRPAERPDRAGDYAGYLWTGSRSIILP